MTRTEAKNDFINDYLETNYKGDSYEASAEREDIGTACSNAIDWADRTMIDKACEYVKQNWVWNTKMIEDFRKALEA